MILSWNGRDRKYLEPLELRGKGDCEKDTDIFSCIVFGWKV